MKPEKTTSEESLHPLELKYGKEPPVTEEELKNPSWH